MLRRLLLLLWASGVVVAMPPRAHADALADLKARYEREKGEAFATRYATLNEIAELGSVEALRFLERVAQADADASLRTNALWSIARVKVPEAAASLLRSWREGDPKQRPTLLSAWVSYRSEALPADLVDDGLAGKDVSTRSNLVRYLGDHDDARFLPEARRFLSDFPGSPTSITHPLTQHPSPGSARLLLEVYDDARVGDRTTIPPVFAGGTPEVRAVLVEAIRAGREPLLAHAAEVAARVKAAECEEALAAAARAAPDDARRAALLEAVGQVGLATSAGRALALEWLGFPRAPVAVAAVRALRGRTPKEAIPPLLALLGAKEEPLRAEARLTLERATGQVFGERRDLWEAWWREHGEAFDPAQVKPPEAGTLDQALVDLALAKGAAALRGLALPSPKNTVPPWSYGGHPVGTTALVLLALHAAGTDPKEPIFQGALRWLLEQEVPDSTYDASLVAVVLESVGGKKHRAKVTEAAKRLLSGQNASGWWGYPSGAGDHSNTQYALLGLRHAARAGATVPGRVWQAARNHWLTTQADDGGWTYVPQSTRDVSSSAMTAAGVSSLLLCLENGELDDVERKRTEGAVDRGFTALGRLAKLDKDGLYALYGIERAGVLGRRTLFGGVPWYVPGATRIVEEQGRNGLWTGSYDPAVDSAFAILFLKRATAPLAVVTR